MEVPLIDDIQRPGQRSRKVAYFEAGFDSWYGAQRSLATLIGAVPQEQIESIIVTTAAGSLSEHARALGISVHILEDGKGVSVSGLSRSFPGPLRLIGLAIALLRVNLSTLRWVRQERIDVLYANNARAMTYFLLPALLLRLPVVWYVRIDQRLPGLFPLALRLADRVICITDMVSQRAFTAHERRRFEKKIRVLWTGFDVVQEPVSDGGRAELRRELGLQGEHRLLLAAGSISERKGHDVLIDAFIKLASSDPKVCLAIAGGPANGSEAFASGLRLKLVRAGLAARVHWLGYRSDISSLYAASDVVVLPSKAEGLPRVVPEALAVGRAVIASNAGGTEELLPERALGVVVPATGDRFADAIAAYLADPQLNAQHNVDKRKAFVAERLSIANYRDGFLKILDELR